MKFKFKALIVAFVVLMTPIGLVSATGETLPPGFNPEAVNQYVAPEKDSQMQDVVINENVSGDLFVAGDRIIVNSRVGDNLFAAGGAIQIDGDTSGDAFIAGGYVVINGDINGDLRVAGGEVFVNGDIKGDLVIFAGKYAISDDANIRGQQILSAGMSLKNTTDNPVDLSKAPDYNTYGNKGFSFNKGDDVSGFLGAFIGFSLIASLIIKMISIAGSILAGYLVLRLFPVFSEKTLETMGQQKMMSLLIGFLTLVVSPIVGILLLISVVGINVFVLLFMLGIMACYLSSTYANYYIGRWIMIKLKRKKTGRALPLAVGFIVVELALFILSLIPILGMLMVFVINLVMISWVIGAMISNKYASLKKN